MSSMWRQDLFIYTLRLFLNDIKPISHTVDRAGSKQAKRK